MAIKFNLLEISHASCLTEPDVYTVLQNLVREIQLNSSRGYVMGLCAFRLGGNGISDETTAAAVTAANIFREHLLPYSSKRIKAVDGLTFKKT